MPAPTGQMSRKAEISCSCRCSSAAAAWECVTRESPCTSTSTSYCCCCSPSCPAAPCGVAGSLSGTPASPQSPSQHRSPQSPSHHRHTGSWRPPPETSPPQVPGSAVEEVSALNPHTGQFTAPQAGLYHYTLAATVGGGIPKQNISQFELIHLLWEGSQY